MFTKREFKFEMFVTVYWSYSKKCVSIIRGTVQLVDLSVVNILILNLLY